MNFLSHRMLSTRVLSVAVLASVALSAYGQQALGTGGYYSGTQIPANLKVDGGVYDSAVIDTSGDLHIFGALRDYFGYSLPGNTKKAVDVSVGYLNGAYVSNTGTIEVFGALGLSPKLVTDAPKSAGFVDVEVGFKAATAIRSNGTLVSWGSDVTRQVSATPAGSFRSVAVSYQSSYGVRTNGQLVHWGTAQNNSAPNPQPDETFTLVTAAVAFENVIALRGDGSLVCVEAENEAVADIPAILNDANLPGFVRVLEVAVGARHGNALLEDGRVLSWGESIQTNPNDPGFSGLWPDVMFESVTATDFGSIAVISPTPALTLSLETNEIRANESATATISIAGKRKMPLALNVYRPAGVIAPPTVVIPAGQTSTTFRVAVARNSTLGQKTVTVLGHPYNQSISFTATPPIQKVAGVIISKATWGDSEVDIDVFMNVWSRTPMVVQVNSTNPAVLVPPTFTIPARSNRATFRVRLADVAVLTSGSITVTYEDSSVTKPIEVRPNRFTGFELSAETASVGETVTGTVTMAVPVANDTVFAITTNRPGVAPSTVTVPAGSSTGTFNLTLTSAHIGRNIKVTVTRDGTSRNQYVFVNP